MRNEPKKTFLIRNNLGLLHSTRHYPVGRAANPQEQGTGARGGTVHGACAGGATQVRQEGHFKML